MIHDGNMMNAIDDLVVQWLSNSKPEASVVIEVSPMAIARMQGTSQTFYEADANRLFPAGCQCHDDSGACDWCRVYYGFDRTDGE